MQAATIPLEPTLPGDADDEARRSAARQRLRILRGEWIDDLAAHLAVHFDAVRERIVGKPDISTNVLGSVVDQLSVLYAQGATVQHQDAAAAVRASEMLAEAGWASLGTEVQRYTLGLREGFLRPSLTSDGRLLLRVVTGDHIHAEASSDEPDLPALVVEARLRTVGGETGWYHDILDVRDKAAPTYRIVRARDGEDVTALVRDGETGWPAQFRRADGTPVMPYVTYHAQRTGRLWNWRVGSEAVEGTLTTAVLWTWWIHCVRDAAWAQRWTLDANARGTSARGAGASMAASIATDPSSVMQFESRGDRAAIGQWNPAIDPLTLGTSIGEFEARLLVHFGLSPGDAQRTEAQSGYAITLNRSAIRQAQRSYAPQFARADTYLLLLVSCLMRGTPNAIPEDGWTVTYPGLPKDWSEIQADIEKAAGLIAAGLASKVDSYMDLHPGMGREQAVAELKRIADETRALG